MVKHESWRWRDLDVTRMGEVYVLRRVTISHKQDGIADNWTVLAIKSKPEGIARAFREAVAKR